MSRDSWLQQTPQWVWCSCIPGFGGLALVYAGYKANTSNWMILGSGITIAALVLSSSHLALPIWLSQIVIALYLKKRYLIKTAPKGVLLPETTQTAALIAQVRGKVDINNCSKDDLVNLLGLPIVYANDIESLQTEGYIFTHLEELHEIAGIPENYLPRLAPLVTFSYDYKKEAHSSWKRLNIMSVQELIAGGLESDVAFKIVAERQKRGVYKSAIDIKRRTNLPFYSYRHLV